MGKYYVLLIVLFPLPVGLFGLLLLIDGSGEWLDYLILSYVLSSHITVTMILDKANKWETFLKPTNKRNKNE